MAHTSTLSFFGGTGSVTGANFMLQTGEQTILVDCGMVQGNENEAKANSEPFPYDPAEADFLFVTHAHADHIGRIPKLIKDGFKGTIYSTLETREISQVMLPDSLRVLEAEARSQGLEAPYSHADVLRAFDLWKTIPYRKPLALAGNVSVELRNAGHILGSAVAVFERAGRKIAFSGDLGQQLPLLLPPAETVPDANYLVIESVYGDRLHESVEERRRKLFEAVRDTAKRKGTLLIPAFSLERTQNILHDLNDMVEGGELDPIPVFIDSPLAIKVTALYSQLSESFNPGIRAAIAAGDDIFKFPKLKFTLRSEESRAIREVADPKVIIAGSGMSNGGRIVGHERIYLPDPKTMVLMVGYQAPGTLGREIQEGAKRVRIQGEDIHVRAEVRTVSGYSAHADCDDLVAFVEPMRESVEEVFVVMGEPKASMFLSQRLHDYLGVKAHCPRQGDRVKIDF
jgi:metallo-beta-lactamase family protein